MKRVNQRKKTEIADNLVCSNYSNKQKLYLYSKSYNNNDVKMAQTLNINARYLGEENNNSVMSIYNKLMEKKLLENGIEC